MTHDFSHATDGIREFLFARQHWSECAFCKITVADFAAAGATKAAHFTYRVARCIVVMHVAALAVGDFHCIYNLCKTEWCQRNDVHALCDTTSKEAGAVGTWQQADFATELTNFIQLAAVGAYAVFDDAAADIFVKRHRECFIVFIFQCRIFFGANLFSHRFVECPAKFVDHLVALWVGFAQFVAQLAFHPFINCFLDIFVWQN